MVAGRNYPAYSFTNHWADILELFAGAGELLGVRPRRTNPVTMSIARRPDVARRDALVEYEPPEPGLPTLYEDGPGYGVGPKVEMGFPMKKCAMPTSSCSATSIDRRDRHHLSLSQASYEVG